jgi:hypothetical protein
MAVLPEGVVEVVGPGDLPVGEDLFLQAVKSDLVLVAQDAVT